MQRFDSCALLVVLACGACAVDDRRLHQGRDDTAGAPSASGGHAGSNGPSHEGGASDPGGSQGEGLVDGCADLDTDGIADCQATLVETPTFTDETAPWLAGAETSLSWDEKNALEDLPSGSAKLSATGPRASASQCVELSGKRLVVAYASAFLEPGDDDARAQALLVVSYFRTSDCSGMRDGFFETPPTGVSDAWITVQAGGVCGPTTASVSIALVAVKPSTATQVTAYFDNVMLRAEDVPE